MPDEAATKICHTCKSQPATVTVRQDGVCRDCFLRYIYGKLVKRMDAVRNSSFNEQKILLLPLSFGVSSMSLLSLLDQHLTNRHEKSGRRPYKLHILHIIDDSVTQSYDPAELLEKVKMRFPQQIYTSIYLSSATSSSKGLPVDGAPSTSSSESLLQRLAAAASPTDVVDIKTKLCTDLIALYAAKMSCDGILWGDSTTRLAEKTMAETAKGRGGLLPELLSEASKAGPASGGIPWLYPARDLLRKELILYCDLSDPPLTGLLIKAPTSAALTARNSTIDDLMTTYFESVEKDYPSIVANVVRTIGKLRAPDAD